MKVVIEVVMLRERLRTNAAARTAHEHVKDSLADEFPHDRRAYSAGKDPFLKHSCMTSPRVRRKMTVR
jgi:GrpB-like predicted nucleotidyltransferase (UPF0157 family)